MEKERRWYVGGLRSAVDTAEYLMTSKGIDTLTAEVRSGRNRGGVVDLKAEPDPSHRLEKMTRGFLGPRRRVEIRGTYEEGSGLATVSLEISPLTTTALIVGCHERAVIGEEGLLQRSLPRLRRWYRMAGLLLSPLATAAVIVLGILSVH